MKIDLEAILAALIDQNEGELFIGMEYMDRNYEGKAIAIDLDALRNGIAMTLIDTEEIKYDDE